MATPSSSYLMWATDPAADVSAPSAAQMASGFVVGQRPTASIFNWAFQQIGAQLRMLAEQTYGTAITSALDPSIRLLGGGMWSYTHTTGVLSWSDTFTLAVPGLADTQNQVAAGSVTLAQGACAFVQGNIPFQATGDLQAGISDVSNVSFVDGIVVGMSVGGGTLPAGTVVQSISGTTLTLSQAPTQSASQVTITFVSNATLTVQTAATSALAITPQTIVFARRYDTDISVAYVGVNAAQMAMRDGELRTLMGPGYGSSQRLVAASALTQRQAVYANVTNGQVAPVNVASNASSNQNAFIGFAESNAAQGAYAHIVSSGVLGGFSGLVPSAVYYCDPATPGGVTNGKPSSSGQAIVPVGVALSTTSLLINPAAAAIAQQVSNNLEVKGNLQVDGTSTFVGAIAGPTVNGNGQPITVQSSLVSPAGYGASLSFPYVNANTVTSTGQVQGGSFVSGSGFLRAIFLGGFSTTNFAGGAQSLVMDYGQGTQARRVTMAYPGSIKSISTSYSNATSAVCAITVFKNGQSFFAVNMGNNSGNTGGYANFTKGQYAFAAGDVLSGYINFGSTGVNTSTQVDITVESAG